MTRTIYALLVGINDYLGGVNGLRGCVNDVKRMAAFLDLRAQSGEYTLKPLVLTSGDRENPGEIKPTRQAVIDGFRDHLNQAEAQDVALFYYSGHGSQELAPPEFWHLEPDHLDETIVCYDSRTEGGWDLADKELALLIAEVANNKPHIVVILDSCHSGSGTRAPGEPGVRLTYNDKRERPITTFLGFDQLQTLPPAAPNAPKAGEWLDLPQSRHVVLSACRPEEVAVERLLGEEIHGILSYYLLDTLQSAGASLSYRDIYARVSTMVRNQVASQNPVLSASDATQVQEPFLGGAIKPQPPYFSLIFRKTLGWVIDGGAVNGIAVPSGKETTTLAVFSQSTDLAVVHRIGDALGIAKVTGVEPGTSKVDFTLASGEAPDPSLVFKAVVVAQPLPAMPVWLQGEEAGLELVRAAMEGVGTSAGPSLIVRTLQPADLADAGPGARQPLPPQLVAPLTLIAQNGRYLIRRTDDAFPLGVPVEQGYTTQAARVAGERLEHVAAWLQLAQLNNNGSVLPPNAVTMEMYAVNADGSCGARIDTTGGDVRLVYQQQDGMWRQPKFLLKLVNQSDRRLYCTLLDLTETFGVHTDGLLPDGGLWLEPKGKTGSEAWANEGQPIPASILKRLREQGVVSFRDILKLIASTTEVPAHQFARDDLDVETRSAKAADRGAAAAPKSTLARLYNRVQWRHIGADDDADEIISAWTTSQITITTVRPRDAVDVPGAGGEAQLSDTVVIEGHAGLQAQGRLTSFDEGARDAGNFALPLAVRQHPELFAPYQFSDYRDGRPGLSVLELDVQGSTYTEVTPEAPLVIRVAKPAEAGEFVLPLAFDAESGLVLPLGLGTGDHTQTTIRIDRLPKPTSETKDLVGSVKLFFQKVVAEKLGLGDGGTTRLAVATVDEQGTAQYDESKATVAQKVKEADRILLYIHGITGDTRRQVASARGLPYPSPEALPLLGDCYDLLLAFDYENLNTPIEETALKLKDHLKAVGLEPGHGKQLHIVAHSMGCLVSRWLIEREGGNAIVQKAVFVGPPNGGSPWAKIQDFALVGLGAAINGLAALIWPPAAIPAFVGMLGSAVAGVETVDVTLDQMKPDSTFYKLLNNSADPKVPYTIVVGNTSKVVDAGPADRTARQNQWEHLLKRLASKETRYALLSLAFFGKPNDMAVSVDSMLTLPPYSMNAEPIEIACDHVSYFVTDVGIRAIAGPLV